MMTERLTVSLISRKPRKMKLVSNRASGMTKRTCCNKRRIKKSKLKKKKAKTK